MQAITFDFHDTLVHCDAWFNLEVGHLPSAFLAWHARERRGSAPESAGIAADARYRRLRAAIVEHGHELSAERSLSMVFEQVGVAITNDDIRAGTEALMRSALASAAPVEGASRTVHELADAGVPLGVVSSAVHHPFLEWALDRFDMLDRFVTVVTSASAGYYKSRPEIYWTAMDRLRANASTSLHVGDSARYDVDGAAAAGIGAIWLKKPGATPPVARPLLTLETLRDAAPAILALLRRHAS